MKTSTIKSKQTELYAQGWALEDSELFGGAGIGIYDNPADIAPDLTAVVTKHAAKVSAAVFLLKDLCGETLDHLNKHEFYGRLAEAANAFQAEHGDNLQMIDAMFDEAIAIMKEWSVKPYLAYGSNMKKDQMADRCPEAWAVRNVTVPNYRFALDNAGVATIIQSPGDTVEAVLWAVNDDDFATLDIYEGVAAGCYSRETIQVPCRDGDGATCEAVVYFSRRELGAPRHRSGYMTGIINAAKDRNFSEGYIAELEGWMEQARI